MISQEIADAIRIKYDHIKDELDERGRRIWAATEAASLGFGGMVATSNQNFTDNIRLSVTVCHFPPGTSKWNKIEHRMFSHITKNWNSIVP